MKSRVVTRGRGWAVLLLASWLATGGSGEAVGQATAKPLTVEERLQKLESMNQQLLEQNQALSQQLKEVVGKIGPQPPAPSPAPVSAEGPPPKDDAAVRTQVSTGSAFGGGDLMSPAMGGPADRSAGPGGNTIENTPSRGSSFGGGDLISFAPDDPADATGIKMNARFGRRFTNNGLWFESPDKVFQFHIGGRDQMDASFFSAGAPVQYGPKGIGTLRDGVDARRMRVRMEGAMYENTLFCAEFDFINSSIPLGRSGAGPLTSVGNTPAAGIPVPLDLWVTFRNIPYIGHIRIGNQKEAMGFERLTSSRFLNFMERSFNQDAFYAPYDNGFVPGISTFSTFADRRGTYALGVYKNVTNPYAYDVGGGNYKATGRMTGLLLYEDDGRQLMHLGISGRLAGYDNGLQRFRVRGPERGGISTAWPNYGNTGVFAGRGGQQDLNLESVNVFGPLTIDAEYNFHFSDDAYIPGKRNLGTLYYSGGYVEALYFLTGEHRAYVRESGLFDRIVPKKNAYWVAGKKGAPNEFGSGAWQVGLRYNYLNLDNKKVDGSVLNDITLGLNWFINPNMKFQWNYSITDRHSPGGLSDGVIQGFGMRYALDY
jgi:phosphate-selective porin OprO/OprP